MKKILMIAAFAIGTYTITSAQTQGKNNTRPTQQQQAERQSERMQKMLDLTAKQKKNVYEVNMEFLQKVEESRKNKQLKMQDIHAEREGKLKNILTKEQYAQWKGNNKMRGRSEGQRVKMNEPQERNKTIKDTEKVAK